MSNHKLVYGFGVNDADYVIYTAVKEYHANESGKTKLKRRIIWSCPFYERWKAMIRRCFHRKEQERSPTYIGCTVCEEWRYFSNFRAWMITQDWEGNQLDKDLIIPGNKVYSPETCIFISRGLNTFLIEKAAGRGEWPLGVTWSNYHKKFKAVCSNPFNKKQDHLGYFSAPEPAHQAWLKHKLELAKMLAAEQDDPRVAKALVERYENYQQNA